jgi:hypothetical protein
LGRVGMIAGLEQEGAILTMLKWGTGSLRIISICFMLIRSYDVVPIVFAVAWTCYGVWSLFTLFPDIRERRTQHFAF